LICYLSSTLKGFFLKDKLFENNKFNRRPPDKIFCFGILLKIEIFKFVFKIKAKNLQS